MGIEPSHLEKITFGRSNLA